MKVSIEISDEQAASLEARAAVFGVTLEEWLRRLLLQQLVLNPKPFKTGRGMWAKYGPAPSAEEIDENRREMLRNFPREIE